MKRQGIRYLTEEEKKRLLRWKTWEKELLEPDAPIFLSRNHRRISHRQVQRDLVKWIREAGIEGHYSPHALRHTVGTELMRKTGNIRLVKDFLGHAGIKTTQVYSHVTKEQLVEGAELLAV